MSHQVVRVKREAVAPCMTCPICCNPFREATTIIECLHTFCRICIYKKLLDETECCPVCNIHLGCAPLEKLRPDHHLQDVGDKIFSCKRTKATGADVTSPISLPAKRKEISTSLLGRGSKSTARKTSRVSRFAIERHAQRGEHSEAGEGGKVDWNPLNCLVDAATKKPKAREEKNSSDYTPRESERPKMWKHRGKKPQTHGELVLLDGAGAKSEHRQYPIWFSLISDEWEGVSQPLPQIASRYIRIKDGSMPVSYIQKYLKMKLNLTSEDEVEIRCLGQRLTPTLPLNNVVDWWIQLMSSDVASVTVGSSAREFVMILGYARKAPDS